MDEIMKLLGELPEDDIKEIMDAASKCKGPEDLIKVAEDKGVTLAGDVAEKLFAGKSDEDSNPLEGLLGNLGGLGSIFGGEK